MTLRWSPSHADGGDGALVTEYDLRYSTTPLDADSWEDAAVVDLDRSGESVRVSGLEPDTEYHFAVRGIDDLGNHSGLSNIASDRTLRRVPEFLFQWGVHGDGPGQFSATSDMACAGDGSVYLGDVNRDKIVKFGPTGEYLTEWGEEGSGDGEFLDIIGIDVDPAGRVCVVDLDTPRVQRFSPDGDFIDAWPLPGDAAHVDCSPDGFTYVVLPDRGILKLDEDGEEVLRWGMNGVGDTQMWFPRCVAADGAGLVAVTDWMTNTLRLYDDEGTLIRFWGGQSGVPGDDLPASIHENRLLMPLGMVFAADGSIFVANTGHIFEYDDPSGDQEIKQFDLEGKLIGRFGGYGSGPGLFKSPRSVDLGPEGKLYVMDIMERSVQVFMP